LVALSIIHRTTYRFGGPVRLEPHRLMLRPRETPDLLLLSFDLQLTPPATVTWGHDVGGNAVATARFTTRSDDLTIESRATVDLVAPAWPDYDIAGFARTYPFAYADDDRTDLGALQRPQYADTAGHLAAWAAGFVQRPTTDTLALLQDVATGIAARITYQSRESEGTQGPLETLGRGWGSCRDLAVLFAEAVRTLGFGARLVSGYLHDPTHAGAGSADTGSTHAWVEVFLPGAGWVAFDPTNRTSGAMNLIPVAAARSIRQIAPVTGSFRSDVPVHAQMSVAVIVACA
jgi:transglutaminase-like putative cysteine protease